MSARFAYFWISAQSHEFLESFWSRLGCFVMTVNKLHCQTPVWTAVNLARDWTTSRPNSYSWFDQSESRILPLSTSGQGRFLSKTKKVAPIFDLQSSRERATIKTFSPTPEPLKTPNRTRPKTPSYQKTRIISLVLNIVYGLGLLSTWCFDGFICGLLGLHDADFSNWIEWAGFWTVRLMLLSERTAVSRQKHTNEIVLWDATGPNHPLDLRMTSYECTRRCFNFLTANWSQNHSNSFRLYSDWIPGSTIVMNKNRAALTDIENW